MPYHIWYRTRPSVSIYKVVRTHTNNQQHIMYHTHWIHDVRYTCHYGTSHYFIKGNASHNITSHNIILYNCVNSHTVTTMIRNRITVHAMYTTYYSMSWFNAVGRDACVRDTCVRAWLRVRYARGRMPAHCCTYDCDVDTAMIIEWFDAAASNDDVIPQKILAQLT